MTRKSLILSLFVAVSSLSAAVKLTDNGQIACSIVLSENAGPVEQHAANELAKFLGRISACPLPEISTREIEGKYPVRLQLVTDSEVSEQGFLLDVRPDAMIIGGRQSIGVLYGVYEVLKKYGGIRWLIPGDEGEYFIVKSSILVPEGRTAKNPDFAFRDISKVCMGYASHVIDSWDWLVRNNGRIVANLSIINNNEKNRKALTERGVVGKAGGHAFSPLLHGTGLEKRTYQEELAKQDRFFAEHPEYFPLINGQRVITRHGGANPQPCTSNPEVINLIAENALRWLDKAEDRSMLIDFGNNDTTAWCQCEKCQSQDPSEEVARRCVSTRYWLFTNAVVDRILKEKPSARISGWSYQNYSEPPTAVKPDSRVDHIMVSNHRRCWKHALSDPNCPTNKWYYDYNRKWNAFGVPLRTYEELSYAGYNFLPNAKNWVDTLQFYHQHLPNFQGMETELCCPDGVYNKTYDKFLIRNNWYMMWQTIYMGMNFMWDVNGDFDAINEEINSLYYGKGWLAGIRDFRALLYKLYMDAGGCWGYGHSIPVGKFLDVPGAKEKLYLYLDSAEKAAVADPDPRALAHVKRERIYFEETWIKAYKDYIDNYREIKVYPLQGNIVIDGKLDEADWKNADGITRFQKTSSGELANYQTAVKLAYDKDNLYMGMECIEPEPGKLKTIVKEHDGPVWEDNDIELFLNDPILGGRYFQIMINASGVICDGSVNPGQKGITASFESNAEVKTSFAEDRWFMEIRLPIQPITGGSLTPGFVLKMNVMRCRLLAENRKASETSTWSSGTPHNVETFHPVVFAGSRAVAPGNRTELDTRPWKNGSFNEVARKPVIPQHWKLKDQQAPAWWSLSSAVQYGGDLELLSHPEMSDNRFVRLRQGFIFQSCQIKSTMIRASCRLRGKAVVRFIALCYKDGRNTHTETLRNETLDSTEWQHLQFEFKNPCKPGENFSVAIFPNAEIDVDDMYLSPKADQP